MPLGLWNPTRRMQDMVILRESSGIIDACGVSVINKVLIGAPKKC